MPKSKKRKNRYTPRPKAQQQTMTVAAQAGESLAPSPAPRPSAPTARTVSVSARSGPPGSKVPVMPQVHVGAELRVIGILTVALFALIVLLYFVLR